MSTTININYHEEEEELKFQEFPLEHPDPPRRTSKGHLGDFPDFEIGEENEELLKEEGGGNGKPKPSFVEFAYYQSFCNVDTAQVMQRIIWSMVPVSGRNSFLNQHIKNNPDLYGPFWISITLIFSIAISSNIADYLSSAGKTNRIWHYDFHKVTIAAITIFSYIFLLPVLLFSLLKYNTMRGVRYTLLEILCAYGYSIFIYIPISILWVIQVPALQWTLVILGAALSGSVLVKNFWPVLRHTNIKIGALVLALILTFHTLLAASFVLYFFKPAPHLGEASLPINVVPPDSLPEVPGSDGIIPINTNDKPDHPSSKAPLLPDSKDNNPAKVIVPALPSVPALPDKTHKTVLEVPTKKDSIPTPKSNPEPKVGEEDGPLAPDEPEKTEGAPVPKPVEGPNPGDVTKTQKPTSPLVTKKSTATRTSQTIHTTKKTPAPGKPIPDEPAPDVPAPDAGKN